MFSTAILSVPFRMGRYHSYTNDTFKPVIGYVTEPFAFVMFNRTFFVSSCSDIRVMGRVLDVVSSSCSGTCGGPVPGFQLVYSGHWKW